MAWANFAILGVGGLLLTVPVILHLMMQPKPKQLPFPALRFVKERQHSNRSRMRLRHFLLLFLRCLLIALVALAFAGPRVASNEFGNWLTLGGIGFSTLLVLVILAIALFSTAHRNWPLISILAVLLIGHLIYGGWSASRLLSDDSVQLIGDSGDPVAALVLIDTSPRMNYVSENETRLDRAKQMGKWLIGQLPLDSQVSVLATDTERPFFSVDVSAAMRRVDTLDTTYVNRSIPESLLDGLRLIEKAQEERKEIYIVTDLTLPSWSAENTEAIARKLRENEGISVFVIDVGVPNPQNFSLSPPELSGGTIPRNGGLTLVSELSRLGSAAQRIVRMRLEKRKVLPDGKLDMSRPQIRDGKTLVPDQFWERTETLDIRENSNALVEFQLTESLPLGTHHGSLELVGDDGLKVDNVRYFTIEVREPWRVLIVRPEGVYTTNVEFTLIPSQRINPDESLFDLTIIDQREIGRPNLADYHAVLLLDPAPLPNTTWGTLKQYVEKGGGLGIFLGRNAGSGLEADPSFLTENAVDLLGGELDIAWRVGNPSELVAEEEKLYLSPNNYAHPTLVDFRRLESGIPWNKLAIYHYWGIEPDANPNNYPTQTVLPFGNGRPAVIERQIGEGRVITMMTSVTEAAGIRNAEPWNDLFSGGQSCWPTFAFLRRTIDYLVQSNADTLNVEVGQVATLRNDRDSFPTEYRMFSPSDESTATTVNVPENTLRYRFTDQPGQYRLKGVFEDPVVRGFSANIRAEATNLTRIDTEQLDLVLGADRYQLALEQDQVQRQQGTTRNGREFYPLLILMMVVILGVENMMSNRFYKTN